MAPSATTSQTRASAWWRWRGCSTWPWPCSTPPPRRDAGMLKLRRGTVVEAGPAGDPMQRLVVEVAGERRAALADVGMVGPAETGDDVVVNVEARDLGLGSG